MTKDGTKKLSARQLKFIAALLQNPSKADAGRAARVPRSTWGRWLTQPAFIDRLEQAREKIFTDALRTIRAGAELAAVELIALLKDKDGGLRRLAADGILRHAFKSYELLEFEERLRRLEETIQVDSHPKRDAFRPGL